MARKFVRTDTGYVYVETPDIPEHFFLMGETERKLVNDWYNWCRKQKAKTKEQKKFLKRVRKAIKVVTYDYRIATIEPSEDENGKICYEVGKPVMRGLSFNEWLEKAKEFMPEHGSDLASLYELYLWYAYRIAKGYWTIEYVCDNSSSKGNYRNSPKTTHVSEVAGARIVGGFADGIGNTYKLAKDLKFGFWPCGGAYHNCGNGCTVASTFHCYDVHTEYSNGSCHIVIKK